MARVPAIAKTHKATGLTKLQHDDAAAGFDHAGHFAQGNARIINIADAEADARNVEARIGIREVHGIGNFELHVEPLTARLCGSMREHVGIEVGAEHASGRTNSLLEAQCQIARARGTVQHVTAGTCSADAHRGCSPEVMHTE